MKTKIMLQEHIEFLSGQLLVLKYACAALIGMRSDRADIIKLIKNIPTYPIEGTSSNASKKGIKNMVEELEACSDIKTLADQFRLLGVEGKA